MIVSIGPAFSVRLKAIRLAAELSQYRLAQLAGVSKQSLSLLEKGETEPTWDTVRKLARALGVSVAEFDLQEPDPIADQPLDSVSEAPAEPRPRPAGKRK